MLGFRVDSVEGLEPRDGKQYGLHRKSLATACQDPNCFTCGGFPFPEYGDPSIKPKILESFILKPPKKYPLFGEAPMCCIKFSYLEEHHALGWKRQKPQTLGKLSIKLLNFYLMYSLPTPVGLGFSSEIEGPEASNLEE